MDLLCFAKPFHHDGWALLRKAFSMMDWLCFAKPIHFDWIALLRKANPLWRIGMALLRKAIPVIQCPAVFWIFVRGVRFFSRFSPMGGWVDMVRIKGLWCPPGVPLRSFPTGGR